MKQKITPFLWFDSQGEEAAKFYVSIFQKSKVGTVTRYTKAGFDVHHMPEGAVVPMGHPASDSEIFLTSH
jgi:predicted 3-demethylubiquinone-9 3-methyltransferase (glyoxalase superfamily)